MFGSRLLRHRVPATILLALLMPLAVASPLGLQPAAAGPSTGIPGGLQPVCAANAVEPDSADGGGCVCPAGYSAFPYDYHSFQCQENTVAPVGGGGGGAGAGAPSYPHPTRPSLR
jgi:hypothetical protein